MLPPSQNVQKKISSEVPVNAMLYGIKHAGRILRAGLICADGSRKSIDKYRLLMRSSVCCWAGIVPRVVVMVLASDAEESGHVLRDAHFILFRTAVRIQ